MKKSESKEFKSMLLNLRSRLRGDVNGLADSALRKTRSEASGDLSSMPIHMADVGTDAFEQEFTLSLMEHDGSALEQIEAALVRIEDGLYGVCVECEGKIPKARLEVLPPDMARKPALAVEAPRRFEPAPIAEPDRRYLDEEEDFDEPDEFADEVPG